MLGPVIRVSACSFDFKPIAHTDAFQHYFPGTYDFITSWLDWLIVWIQWSIGMDLEWPRWYKISLYVYAHVLILGLGALSFCMGLMAACQRPADPNGCAVFCLGTLPWLFALFLAYLVEF